MNTIDLPSSDDRNVLVEKIVLANQTGATLNLLPGPHYTKRGHRKQILINGNGLHITGTLGLGEYSSIKRPDNALDADNTDSFGLVFIPSAPTLPEWASITSWKLYINVNKVTNTVTTYEYAIIRRGRITIENLELDCNMGNQIKTPSEHSSMLGFAGQKYSNTAYPDKFVFVAFEDVIINNIRSVRGGFADDIWIGRGYFRPNIGKVLINNITSQNRINEKRATISFSGLTQNVEISNANIFKVEAESTSDIWNELPGEDIYSHWKLDNIICDQLDIAAKGKAIFLNADNVKTNQSTYLYQIGGLIQDCIFMVASGENRRLFRLNSPTFKRVTWIFPVDINGEVKGLAPKPQYGDSCAAVFDQNTFLIKGNILKGVLIDTEYSRAEASNYLNLEFRNCVFDQRVGSPVFPNTHIAQIYERGHWKFTPEHFGSIPIDRALIILPGAIQTTNIGVLEINVP